MESLSPMSSSSKRRGSAGFTLVELMIVLAVVGIIAGVATTNVLTQLPGYRVQRAAAQLAWNLRALRMRAISQHHAIAVTFTNDHVYTVWTDSNDDGASDAGEVQTIDINATYSGVTMAATNNPVLNATGTVSNPAVITLTGAGIARTISMTIAGGIKLH